MNRRTAIAMLGVVGLALLLAGCAGLFKPLVNPEEGALSPIDPAVVGTIDPRLLGEGLIQPGEDYKPDRIIVGVQDSPPGRAALNRVLALVGQMGTAADVKDQVDLGQVVVVEIDIRDDLDVAEALGLVLLLVAGRLEVDRLTEVPAKGSPPPARIRPTTRGGEPVPGILFAEPSYIIKPPEPIPEPLDVKATLMPKVYDPSADLRPYQWGLDAVNAEAAWATGYTGRGVLVAVLDTGVDSTHPDLVDKVIEHVDPRTDPISVLAPPRNFDTDGHGTHCAAIIAAKNDGRGVVGLAYDAQILDVRIFVPGFIGLVPTARGIKYAVDRGAKVLSNSWGGVAYSQVLKAAFDYALSRGVTVVAAAGNSYNTIWFRPASIAGIIAVGASTPHNTKVDFSTMGTWLSVSAPGVDVLSAVHTGIIQAGTGLPLLYDYWSGTSMSCPHVSALAAMILEKHPTATPYQVKKLIERTAKDLEAPGFDIRTGYGLIQADRALTASLPANDGAALRMHVVTASSMPLWGQWWPVTTMDVTLRKDGRIIERGQTDFEGWVNIGFPVGDYPPGRGLGYFPILEPGTYEVVVGGDDCTLMWGNYRTANRVTGRATVTLTPGGVHTVDVSVNTTLKVTLTWSGGGADTDIDLAVWEPGVGWTFAWSAGPWGTWTPDQSGASGTETYTLLFPHYDDDRYGLAVVFWGGLAPTTTTVRVEQNGVVETYTIRITLPGMYPASPGTPDMVVGGTTLPRRVTRWPGWWDGYGGPWVF
jgi:subtilisin family serine protease